MNVRTLIQKTATATAFAAMAIFAGACSHNKAAGDFGHVDNSQASMTSSTNQADTAVNNNGDVTNAPAVTNVAANATPIPGPAKVDSTGNAYTSSAAPGTGNAAAVGTNTNVNLIPKSAKSSSSVTYTEAQTTPVVETPAPTVVETPAPIVTAPTITETQTTTTETAPMTSSTTEKTTTETTTTTTHTHKRMRKD